MRRGRKLGCLVATLLLSSLFLMACGTPQVVDEQPEVAATPLSEATPPPQSLLIPGEIIEGELSAGETDRWIWASAAGELATVEVWFRPATASGPEAEIVATLVGPDGMELAREPGTVTLPPYIVEQELPQTGSYLLRLEAPSGTPGRYTLLVSLAGERVLTRQDIYTGTLFADGLLPPDGGEGGSPGWGFIWPAPQRRISGWYFRDPEKPSHNGLDIGAALYDPIIAAAQGTVSFAEWSGPYGNLVILEHAGGWESRYAHLAIIYVSVGEQVMQGATIGGAGSTGHSTGPHLHLELRFQGEPVDPLVYIQR